jgi:hypothetical protein
MPKKGHPEEQVFSRWKKQSEGLGVSELREQSDEKRLGNPWKAMFSSA